MSAVTATGSLTLPSSIPKLLENGVNWPVFDELFTTHVRSLDAPIWSHFDGSSIKPVPVNAATPTPEEIEAASKWDSLEFKARSLLNQRVPEGVVMQLRKLATNSERWAAVKRDYSKKGEFLRESYRREFRNRICEKGMTVRQFIDGLRTRRAELDAMGVEILDETYRATIIQGLPPSISDFASGLIATARMTSSIYNLTVTPLLGSTTAPTADIVDLDALTHEIVEEAERRTLKRQDGQPSRQKTDTNDAAMSVQHAGSNSKSKGSKSKDGKPHFRGKDGCWNCGSFDHMKNDCPKPPKAKGTASSGTGTAAAVTTCTSTLFTILSLYLSPEI
jgi:hypothetical protein